MSLTYQALTPSVFPVPQSWNDSLTTPPALSGVSPVNLCNEMHNGSLYDAGDDENPFKGESPSAHMTAIETSCCMLIPQPILGPGAQNTLVLYSVDSTFHHGDNTKFCSNKSNGDDPDDMPNRSTCQELILHPVLSLQAVNALIVHPMAANWEAQRALEKEHFWLGL